MHSKHPIVQLHHMCQLTVLLTHVSEGCSVSSHILDTSPLSSTGGSFPGGIRLFTSWERDCHRSVQISVFAPRYLADLVSTHGQLISRHLCQTHFIRGEAHPVRTLAVELESRYTNTNTKIDLCLHGYLKYGLQQLQ